MVQLASTGRYCLKRIVQHEEQAKPPFAIMVFVRPCMLPSCL